MVNIIYTSLDDNSEYTISNANITIIQDASSSSNGTDTLLDILPIEPFNIKYLIIDGNIKIDDNYTFYWYTNLEGIEFINNYEPNFEIPDNAFNYEPFIGYNIPIKFKKIILPNTTIRIGKYAFYESLLESINSPTSLQIIDDYAFFKCYSLTSFTVPPNVSYIGAYSFENMNLANIYFTNSLRNNIIIHDYMFNNKRPLTIHFEDITYEQYLNLNPTENNISKYIHYVITK